MTEAAPTLFALAPLCDACGAVADLRVWRRDDDTERHYCPDHHDTGTTWAATFGTEGGTVTTC